MILSVAKSNYYIKPGAVIAISSWNLNLVLGVLNLYDSWYGTDTLIKVENFDDYVNLLKSYYLNFSNYYTCKV